MNREVSLTKRVRTEKGLRYCSVVLAANGRVKPDYVLVNDQAERHPEDFLVQREEAHLRVGR